MKNKIPLAFLTLFLLAPPGWAGERGYFGFALTVDGGGKFWNPSLLSVRIKEVSPASPTALAGMVSGADIM